LQNPLAGNAGEFKPEYIRRYELRPQTLNVALLVDPASSKKKGSSDTAMTVIGMDAQWNKYFLDGAIHKMDLNEKWIAMKNFRSKWLGRPGIQTFTIGYEKYAHQTDIEHYNQMMRIEGNTFPIETVSWPRDMVEGSKRDRIRRLLPDHQNWKFFYPYEGDLTALQKRAMLSGRKHLIAEPVKKKNHDGRLYNVVDYIINSEMMFFPAVVKLDGLDSMSRFYDLNIQPPTLFDEKDVYPEITGDDY